MEELRKEIEERLKEKFTVEPMYNIHRDPVGIKVSNEFSFEVLFDLEDDIDEQIDYINYLCEIEKGWDEFEIIKETHKMINELEGVSGKFERVCFGVYEMSLKLENYFEHIFYGGTPKLTVELKHDLNLYALVLTSIHPEHQHSVNIMETLNKIAENE